MARLSLNHDTDYPDPDFSLFSSTVERDCLTSVVAALKPGHGVT